MTLFFKAVQREQRQTRADRIEDLLTAGADTEKGVNAAMKRIKDLRKE